VTLETRVEDGITHVLFDRGTLVHLYVGRWTGNKKLRETDLLIEDIDANAVHLGHKKLLPKEAGIHLQSLESQARMFLASRSIPFPIGSARFVYYRALPELLQRFRALREEWNQAVADLLSNYTALKEQQLQLLDDQSKKLMDQKLLAISDVTARARKRIELKEWMEEQRRLNKSMYLEVEELQRRFVFEWRMFKVSPLEGMEQMSSLEQQDLAEAQARIREDLQRWVREVSVEMHKALGNAAANAKRLLEQQGKLNPKNLKPLFDAFDSFKAINFTGAGDFQAVIDQIKGKYLVTDGAGSADYQATATHVNGSPEDLSALLAAVSNLAVDQVAEEAGIAAIRNAGEFSRFVDV
jgi:hypothetical protein